LNAFAESYEKQIVLAEKLNDKSEANRLRRAYEAMLEAWRAQEELNKIAPRQVKIDEPSVSEEDEESLRNLLSRSRAVPESALSSEERLLRGNSYYEVGDYYEALEEYSGAIALRPAYASAYYNRGNTYRRKGEDDRAIQTSTGPWSLGRTTRRPSTTAGMPTAMRGTTTGPSRTMTRPLT